MSKFTVKVRHADGTEELFACDTITVIGGPQAVCSASEPVPRPSMFEDGIFLDRDPIPLNPGEPTAPIHSVRHVIYFGGEETEERKRRKGGRVWVMNSAGQTVATYDL